MTIASLEDTISVDNPIRFIDAFVDKLDTKHQCVLPEPSEEDENHSTTKQKKGGHQILKISFKLVYDSSISVRHAIGSVQHRVHCWLCKPNEPFAVCALHPQDTLCSVEEKFENTNFGLRIKIMECYFSRRCKSFMGGLTIRTISTSQGGLS